MTKCALLLSVVMLATTPAVRAQAPQTKPPQTVAPPATSEDVSVQKDVPYGTAGGHPLLLDIYDSGERSPDLKAAVVLIHGGGWTSFDKDTMRGMGTFLARSGFVAFSVDYRLLQGTENLWPVQLDDVQRAVRWIRGNAAKYRIDPDHVGAFGHSAGAQLAALLGMEDTRDNSDPALAKYSSRVQAVVDVSGPSDFTTNRDRDGDAFLATFFGGDYVHAAKTWVEFVTVEDVHTFRTPEARKRLALETRAFFVQYLRSGNLR